MEKKPSNALEEFFKRQEQEISPFNLRDRTGKPVDPHSEQGQEILKDLPRCTGVVLKQTPSFRLKGPLRKPIDLTSDRAKEILEAELCTWNPHGNPNQPSTLKSPQVPRKPSYTEVFESFVRALSDEELLELGDILVKNSDQYGLGDYFSKTLGARERIYQSDLPFVYAEFKKRFLAATSR